MTRALIKKTPHYSRSGFTIVELLIVIVVIGILAAITIVGYNGITRQAESAHMQAEANNIKKQLDSNLILGQEYPVALTSLTENVDAKLSFQYTRDVSSSPAYYCVSVTSSRSDDSFYVSTTESVKSGLCPGHVSASAEPAETFTFQNITFNDLNRPVGGAFADIAVSQNGKTIYGAYANGGSGGYIYKSTDSGDTWVELTSAGALRWESIDVSDDGQKLVAVTSAATGEVFTSADGGSTWVNRSATGAILVANWKVAAISGDGTKMTAGYEIGDVFASSDGGTTWTNVTSTTDDRRWAEMDMSTDGAYSYSVTHCESNGGFSRSSTGIMAYAIQASIICTNGIAVSATGQYVLVGKTIQYTPSYVNGNGLSYSDDYGQTWQDWSAKVNNASNTYIGDVGISDDGQRMITYRVNTPYYYISKDGGATWTYYSAGSFTASNYPRNIAVAGNGAVYYAESSSKLIRAKFD